MKINLEATLKKEQNFVSKLTIKYGWKWFSICSILFFVGINMLANSKERPMMICGGSISIVISICVLIFGAGYTKRKTNKVLHTRSIQVYLKGKIKDYLVQDNCYHENILTHLISKYNEKSKLQFNSAVFISLLIFVFSPFWSVLLNICYENTKSIGNLFFLLLIVLSSVFLIYILSRFILSAYLYKNVHLRNLLEDILLDYYFEQNSKS